MSVTSKLAEPRIATGMPPRESGGMGLVSLPGLISIATGSGAAIANVKFPPAAIAEAVPSVPSTEGGGVACPWSFKPQQTTVPLPAWIAQLCPEPTVIAVAVPLVPLTDAGGVASPEALLQQITAPLPDWIAQLCQPPAAIAVAVPALPSTSGGGVAG